MNNLAGFVLQGALSAVGLFHLIGVGVLVAAAIWSGPRRSVLRFLLVGLGLCVVASVLSAVSSSTPREAFVGVIWALSILAFYAAVLGVLVAKGKGPRTIVATAAVLLLVQVPYSLFSGLYLTCFILHDCL